MVAGNWERAYKVERVYEGGNIDDKRDRGGRTSRGITQRTYNADRKRRGLPLRDVFKATEDEVANIYREQYANAVRFDELRSGVDLVLLDGAIHSGPSQSIKWLQAALRQLRIYKGKIDGIMGIGTMQALEAVHDDDVLIELTLQFRMGSLKRFPTWNVYKNGWTKRVSNVKKVAQAWAMGSVGPMPEPQDWDVEPSKANPPSIDKPVKEIGKGVGTTETGGAIVILSEAARQGKEQLAPYAGVGYVDKLLVALTVFGVVLAIGGVIYTRYQKRQAKKAVEVDEAQPRASVPDDVEDAEWQDSYEPAVA